MYFLTSNIILESLLITLSLVYLLPDRLKWWHYFVIFCYNAMLSSIFLTINITNFAGIASYKYGYPVSIFMTYIFMLVGCLGLLCIFSRNKLVNAIHMTLGLIINLICNYLWTNLILLPTQHKYWEFYSKNFYFLMQWAFPLFLFVALVLIRRLLYCKLDFQVSHLPAKIKTILFFFHLLCAIFLLSPVLFGISHEMDGQAYKLATFLMTGIGIFFFAIFILLYYTASYMQKASVAREKVAAYDTLQEYTDKLEELYQEMRSFRHDYHNILTTFYGYIEKNDMPGLSAYFHTNVMKISKELEISNLELGLLSNIQIPELKGLFTAKLIHALHLNIQLHLVNPHPITQIHMDVLDAVRLFGIYLDNAIESAVDTEERTLHISFLYDGKMLTVTIGNSCKTNTLPLGKLCDPEYSTKGDKRGIGLYNATQILEKYPQILSASSLQEHYFTQTLKNL